MKHIINPKLGIYVDARTPQTHSLTQLLKDQFINELIPPTIDITLTLAPCVKMVLIDDLLSRHQNTKIIKHTLTFALHEGCSLEYNLPSSQHISLKGLIIEKELIIKLLGQGAHAAISCACLGTSDTIYKFKTIQDHNASNTTSTLAIKSVIDQQATIVANNLINVESNLENVTAEQSCKSILLSDTAKAIALPQLEIKSDNVMCKHGAAISTLNDEHRFYLKSRGLSETETQQALVDGFLKTH